ncbi:MAG: hypothetical protein SFU91_04505 [Chloroherpetonaceae bacterium]|nr:hypothetical protein [Chloroherpetonaceae bacterium]
MNNFELIKAVSETVAKPPVLIEKWLNQAFHQAEIELLTRGALPLAGIGMLRKTLLPAEPKEVGGELVLAPPKMAIILQKDAPLKEDYLAAIAVGCLNITESDAKLLSRNFAKIAKNQIDSGKQIRVGRLGAIMISPESLQLTFVPTTWATSLLSKTAGDLEPISLAGDSQTSEKPKIPSLQSKENSDFPISPILFESSSQISSPKVGVPLETVNEKLEQKKIPEISLSEVIPSPIDNSQTQEIQSETEIEPTNSFSPEMNLVPDRQEPKVSLESLPLIPSLTADEVNKMFVKENNDNTILPIIAEGETSSAEKSNPEVPSEPPPKKKKVIYTDDIYDPYYEPPIPKYTYQPPKDFTPDLTSGAIHHDEEGINTTLAELEETLDKERQKETRRNIFIIVIIGVVIVGGVWLYQNTIADNVNAVLTQKIEEQEKAKEKTIQHQENKQEEVKVNVDSALIAYQKESKIRQEQERFTKILKAAGSSAKLPPMTKKPINPSKGGFGVKLGEYKSLEEALGVGAVYAKAKISNYTFTIGSNDDEKFIIVAGQFPTAAAVQQLIRRFPKFFPEKAEPVAIKKPVKK